MKILFFLHHPAHFYLFRNTIHSLKENGHEIILLATRKDFLEILLDREGFSYTNVLPKGRKDNRFAIAIGLLKQDFRLLQVCLEHKPDLLVGTSTEICHIGRLLKIPNLFTNEDDIEIIPLVGKIAYPFARNLLIPDCCSTGKWEGKSIKYPGYHELAYLHPNHFSPDPEVLIKYHLSDDSYFIIRFAKLTAHHDSGAKGISTDIARNLIEILESSGAILITSERELEPEFEKYRLDINPLDIHHIISFASLFIGDSQTMAAESGVLGTPFIRYNDFVGRIGYLDELENKYHLGYGIKTSEEKKLYSTVRDLISTPNLKDEWKLRRQNMLSEKIDVSQYLTQLIENYPQSIQNHDNCSDYLADPKQIL
ncbi:DUF354 domain-containing protein [Bacteroidota bacterium]